MLVYRWEGGSKWGWISNTLPTLQHHQLLPYTIPNEGGVATPILYHGKSKVKRTQNAIYVFMLKRVLSKYLWTFEQTLRKRMNRATSSQSRPVSQHVHLIFSFHKHTLKKQIMLVLMKNYNIKINLRTTKLMSRATWLLLLVSLCWCLAEARSESERK